MPLGTEVGLGLRDIVFDVDPATPIKRTHPPHPIFGPCLLWPRSPISATAELLYIFKFGYVMLVNEDGWIFPLKSKASEILTLDNSPLTSQSNADPIVSQNPSYTHTHLVTCLFNSKLTIITA